MWGPVTRPMTLASIAEVPERLDQRPGHLLLPGGVGPGRLAGGACRGTGLPGAAIKLGIVGDRRAVATLRGEIGRVELGRAPGARDARALARPSPSSEASMSPTPSAVVELGRRRISRDGIAPSSGVPRRAWRARSARRCRAQAAAAARAAGRDRVAARRRRPRACGVLGWPGGRADQRGGRASVDRRTARLVPTIPRRWRARRRQRGAGDQDQPGEQQEHRQDVGPDRENRCELTQNSRLADDAASALEGRRDARTGAAGARPGPIPSVPAASASVSAATRQTSPVRSGRAGGRSSRIRTSAPAATAPPGTA